MSMDLLSRLMGVYSPAVHGMPQSAHGTPATGTHLKTITGHTDAVASVTFSADGSTLATRSWDKTIRLWDVETHEVRHTITEHEDDVWTVAFSPDGKTLASGGMAPQSRVEVSMARFFCGNFQS